MPISPQAAERDEHELAVVLMLCGFHRRVPAATVAVEIADGDQVSADSIVSIASRAVRKKQTARCVDALEQPLAGAARAG